MKSLLHREFKYTNAAASAKPGYLRRKFERIRRDMAAKAEAEKANPVTSVRQIKRAK